MARSENRTERPTPKRRQEARREGRTAKSKEVGVAASLLVSVIALRFIAPPAVGVIADKAQTLLANSGNGLAASGAGEASVAMVLAGILPFLAAATVAGVAGGVAQVGFHLAPKAAKPKLSHLSLKRGLQRLKPSVAGWELLRSLLKIGLLMAIIWQPVVAWVHRLGAPTDLIAAARSTFGMVGSVLLRGALLALAIAAVDYGINRYRTQKELKMTRQELRDELKNTDGDPLIRSARRRRQSELSRNRMIRDVATADVVLTNPTRLAVALRYGRGYPSPQVIAKGSGKMAAVIRREAYRNGVPVIEDKSLARALFRRVNVGQYVPTALFEAVAVILAAAYRRRGRRAA